MTKTITFPQPDDLDRAVRKRILERAKALNAEIVLRIATAANELDAGEYRAALGGLESVEQQLTTIRSILLLLP